MTASPMTSGSGVCEVVSDAVIGGWFARKGEPIYLPIRRGYKRLTSNWHRSGKWKVNF